MVRGKQNINKEYKLKFVNTVCTRREKITDLLVSTTEQNCSRMTCHNIVTTSGINTARFAATFVKACW